jgi:hypothetical protein
VEIRKKDLEDLMKWEATKALTENPHLPPYVTSVIWDYFSLKYLLHSLGFKWDPKRVGRILTALVKEGKLFITHPRERVPGIIWVIDLEWPIVKGKEPGPLENLVKSGKTEIVVDEEGQELLLKLRKLRR